MQMLIRDLVAVILAVLFGFGLGYAAMWVSLKIAPPTGFENAEWLTIGVSSIMVLFALSYLRKKFGLGDYDDPDDYLPSTSTVLKAEQQARIDRWNRGESDTTW